MPAARFCSECGARLRGRRTSILPFRSLCSECSRHYHHIRAIVIIIPVLCAVIGFGIGKYSAASEPFYFIGTPVDLSAGRVTTFSNGNENHPSGGSATPRQPEPLALPLRDERTICGALTKSGKPCRRTVKGGGNCWQHRAAATTGK